jgi:hypothetical protein
MSARRLPDILPSSPHSTSGVRYGAASRIAARHLALSLYHWAEYWAAHERRPPCLGAQRKAPCPRRLCPWIRSRPESGPSGRPRAVESVTPRPDAATANHRGRFRLVSCGRGFLSTLGVDIGKRGPRYLPRTFGISTGRVLRPIPRAAEAIPPTPRGPRRSRAAFPVLSTASRATSRPSGRMMKTAPRGSGRPLDRTGPRGRSLQTCQPDRPERSRCLSAYPARSKTTSSA